MEKLGGGAGAADHRPLDFPTEEKNRGRNQSSRNTKKLRTPGIKPGVRSLQRGNEDGKDRRKLDASR